MLWLILGLAGVEDGLWGGTLGAHVSLAGVDYQAIGPTGLDPYLAQLAAADLSGASKAEKMAFWINAYNALTVDLIAENQGIASIRDLDGGKVWAKRQFTVAGQQVSLNDIEHGTLRPMGDARVHAALNCASKGCPPLPLKPVSAATLEADLDTAARQWVATNAWVVQDERIALNKIFDWYGDDFVPKYGELHDVPEQSGKKQAALNFIAVHAPTLDLATLAKNPGVKVVYGGYDWSVNRR
ncbi:MAG: hypothetical protein ACI9VR_002194 [Cognaticolwellia sp.]|jgi:hypothetical protein